MFKLIALLANVSTLFCCIRQIKTTFLLYNFALKYRRNNNHSKLSSECLSSAFFSLLCAWAVLCWSGLYPVSIINVWSIAVYVLWGPKQDFRCRLRLDASGIGNLYSVAFNIHIWWATAGPIISLSTHKSRLMENQARRT